jgi:hypothetical protein
MPRFYRAGEDEVEPSPGATAGAIPIIEQV